MENNQTIITMKTNQADNANATSCTPPPLPPSTNPETWRRFFNEVCAEERKNRMQINPYNFEEWFRGAYNTFGWILRRGGKRPLTEDEKADCARFILNELQNLTADNLGKEWQKIIKKLVTRYPESLRVGTAQFLISLPCKFAYTLWVIYPDELRDPWCRLLESIGRKCPVPINRNVIYNLKKRYPEEFPDLCCRGPERLIRSCSKDICVWGPWTQLEDYVTYWLLQIRIRALADQEQITPMEFEARYLWNQVGDGEN